MSQLSIETKHNGELFLSRDGARRKEVEMGSLLRLHIGERLDKVVCVLEEEIRMVTAFGITTPLMVVNAPGLALTAIDSAHEEVMTCSIDDPRPVAGPLGVLVGLLEVKTGKMLSAVAKGCNLVGLERFPLLAFLRNQEVGRAPAEGTTDVCPDIGLRAAQKVCHGLTPLAVVTG